MTKLAAVTSSASRAVLQQREAQRLAIDVRCQLNWSMYRTEWRHNAKAGQYIVQKVRPLVDTDVKATPRGRYDLNALRLNWKCPGCGETLRPNMECRFDQELVCASNPNRDEGGCPGWCRTLGLRERPDF